ncbi:MAG: phosphotransferase [Patescibacteria group bacterium]|jgi:hypothetical protein
MNPILSLFDENFAADLFKERILPRYPNFKKVKKVKIFPVKKNIWEKAYHVVIEYEVSFIDDKKRIEKLPVFCSAHDSEPRKNVYTALKFLWDNGFSQGYLTIPRPLFYSNRFNAVFYRGVKGHNLFHYICEKNYPEIERIVGKSALWLARLHKAPTDNALNFNKANSRIETVVPGKKHILSVIGERYPEYSGLLEEAFNIVISREKKFLNASRKRWIIHGDAHPENVIKIGHKKMAFIDFTDICLADFTRDIGSFLQQLEYKCRRRIGDEEFTKKVKNIFLSAYFKNSEIKMGDAITERIATYYNWTALRTAVYLLLKHDPKPERAAELLEEVKNNLLGT